MVFLHTHSLTGTRGTCRVITASNEEDEEEEEDVEEEDDGLPTETVYLSESFFLRSVPIFFPRYPSTDCVSSLSFM